MYTVKKFYLGNHRYSDGKTLPGAGFGIINEKGEIAVTTHSATGLPFRHLYDQKGSAQQQADHMNKQGESVMGSEALRGAIKAEVRRLIEGQREAPRKGRAMGRAKEVQSAQQALGGLDWFGFGTACLYGRGKGLERIQVSMITGDYVGGEVRQPDGQTLPYKVGGQTWHFYYGRKDPGGRWKTMGEAQHAAVAWLKQQGLI